MDFVKYSKLKLPIFCHKIAIKNIPTFLHKSRPLKKNYSRISSEQECDIFSLIKKIYSKKKNKFETFGNVEHVLCCCHYF